MQPVYGFLSDRFHTRMFTALAPAVAGIFIASLGIAPGFYTVLLCVALGGAGIASFHPQGTAWAAAGVESNRGRWMAVFISAGTLGMAYGPSFFTSIITRIGFDRVYWAAIPGVVVTIALVAMLPAAPRAHNTGGAIDWAELNRFAKPLTVHYFLVFIRSILQITYAQFLPLYLHRERGFTLAEANHALSFYLAAGAIGGFAGGHLADRFGGRRVIEISMLGCLPFLAVFYLTSGITALAGLAIGGLILLFTIPVNVVMAQQLVPRQASTVSALMMGFSWGMAGLVFIPIVGVVSDLTSMHTALSGLLVFPVAGYLLTRQLPR